ncbi:carboxypeptidase-like regulatory domain-containing protein [uncultured Muribaculum sp.]|uniref:carboxypeptidase-like regulatory domain-containing protein n=1 Tax=uncultured Muribaculum sp. TaxID=1918613 RepID=UPI0025D78FB8|nr:carboxypeptidase-like regulatory domain-containing protein [uncultured Muribaculum sp.]
MARGKRTCKILKEIRRQIAEANGIEFVTSECRYRGDCLGTCPKCEAEVRYLEEQLRARRLMGKAIALAGVSAGALAMFMPTASCAQTSPDSTAFLKDSIVATTTDTIRIKGVVLSGDTLPDGSISKEPLIGAIVLNRSIGTGTVSDLDGNFNICAYVGDTLEVEYVGYETMTIAVTDDMRDTTVTLAPAQALLGEMVIAGLAPVVQREEHHYLDLNVIDKDGNRIDRENLYIERIVIDDNGETDSVFLSPEYFDEKHPCRIYWDYDYGLRDENGNPVKEATLSIEADGYDDPVIINVKYPKRNAKKTVKFKNNNGKQ